MRNNISSLIKQEMVNRFETVVKNEINESNRSIAETKKSLDQMRKDIDSFKEENLKLRNSNQEIYNRLSIQSVNDKVDLEAKFKQHIASNSKTIDKFLVSLSSACDKVNNCIEKDAYDQDKLEERKLNERKFDEIRNDLYLSISQLRNLSEENLEKTIEIYKHTFSDQQKLEKRLLEVNTQLETYQIEFTGLLKELRVYKRENFIATKEIEKLYILIERLEKRIKS